MRKEKGEKPTSHEVILLHSTKPELSVQLELLRQLWQLFMLEQSTLPF